MSVTDLELTGDPRQLLTSAQTAAFLSISIDTLNRLVKEGLLHPTRLRNTTARRFRLDEVHRFIDDRTED